MAWRGLHISNPARLSLERGSLKVVQGDNVKLFPVEDLSWVIFDTKQIELTASLLSLCMEKGVVVIVSDEKHMPCGALLPFNAHFRPMDVTQTQISASQSLKDRIWRVIVRAKIVNQAQVLQTYNHSKEKAQTLLAMARLVESGDRVNVEARAARFYWSNLFTDFNRHNNKDSRNAMLNYGYAILRSAIARFLSVSGLLPFLGIHHRSLSNPFNLADDLIEPYRPWVDALTFSRSQEPSSQEGELSLEDRQNLSTILTMETCLEQQRLSVLNAIERSVDSLVRTFRDKNEKLLLLPSLLEK